MKKLLLAVAIVAVLAACSKKEVAFDTLETARAQAKSNAEFNAKNYRAENPRFTDHQIISHGDTSQTPDCPQGDGWASLTIMKVNGKEIEKYPLKCSTVSANLGCYLDVDFKKKATLAGDDGVCQPLNKVPFPLPKIAK